MADLTFKEIYTSRKMMPGSKLVDENEREVIIRRVDALVDLPAQGTTLNEIYWVIATHKFYKWDTAGETWLPAKVDAGDITSKWLEPVPTYTDLTTTYPTPSDGSVCLVIDELTFYAYSNNIWYTPAAYPKGFTSGCRLIWYSQDQIEIDSGVMEVAGSFVQRDNHVLLDWATDIEPGVTRKPDTWYYVYIQKDPTDNTHFVGLISETYPTRDQYGNTLDPAENQAKYHPTLNGTRFVGSFRTDFNSNILRFIVVGNYVSYIAQGYNYILQNGDMQVQTAVNCRFYVPITSGLANFYYQSNSFNKTTYIGDAYAWYLFTTGGSGAILLPVTNNSVYYYVTGSSCSIGVHGYYEDI